MSRSIEDMRRDRMRPSSCRMKNHYDSAFYAERARLKQQARHGWLMKTYQCDDCGGWHLARIKVEGKAVPIIGWVDPDLLDALPSEVMEVES